MTAFTRLLLPALLGLLSASAGAGVLDDLKKTWEEVQPSSSDPAARGGASLLGDEEVARGLKEALAKGTRQAVASLGQEGGFLNNPAVRIPLPDELKQVEKVLRGLGKGKYADQFQAALNRAAEKAVPEAAALFTDAISRMTLADAKSILKGPDDAATRYFRKTSEPQLKERFRPIVKAATEEVGITSAYKKLMQKSGPTVQLLGLGNMDLDAYVENEAVDGLFTMIAAEEKRIRQDPLARGTDLLKKVFGTLGP